VTEKKRGGWMTAVLIFAMIVFFLGGAILIIGNFAASDEIHKLFPNRPGWVNLFQGLLCFANLAAAVGVWKFKKWGVIAFGVSTAAGLICNVFFYGIEIRSIFVLLAAFIGFGMIVSSSFWKRMD